MEPQRQAVAETIPVWDGNPRGWRRYQREVLWYCLGQKKHARKLLAPRLIARLTGPARLLAMSWNQADFTGKRGITMLLKKLAASPLVRKNLPNTQAIMNQYFGYKRMPGESIANYLVRESLYYEEFTESLGALHDEQHGVTPSSFELPDSSDDESSDGSKSDKSSQKGKTDERYRRVPTEDPDRERGDDGDRREGEVRSRGGASVRGLAPPGLALPSLSTADSFILKQLRGWRLLSGALLSSEDIRSIMASTNNRLDYENISVALTILFDEQLHPGHRQVHGHSSPQVFSLEEDGWDDSGWSSWDPWANSSEWWEDEWGWYDGEAIYEEAEPQPAEAEGDPPGEAGGDLQAADRSWSQAQRSTQLMKKDRGFGGAVAMSKGGSKGETCHICGSPQHFARECPDRQSPYARGKGFGKNHYMMDEETMYAIYKGKGKHRPSGTKGANYMADELYYLKGKASGKGKSKSKSKGKNKGTVNAYVSDWQGYYGYGIEFDENETSYDLQANESMGPPRQSGLGKHYGMLDTGATCSAGPEASIKKMIAAVLEKDSKAKLTFDMKKRPRFRFGSGRWGRALYKVTMSSSLSNVSFSAFALPDPDEISEEWFDENMLVPVLIGMDFINHHGLIVDFSDGFSVCAKDPQAQPFHLPKNEKGHFMLNVADFVTNGKICSEGSPEIHVLLDESMSVDSFRCGEDSLQLRSLFFEDEDDQDESENFMSEMSSQHLVFHELWSRRRDLNASRFGLMGSVLSTTSRSTSPTRVRFSHGAQEERLGGGFGSESIRGRRSTRSSEQDSSMALLRKSPGHESEGQQVGDVGALSSVQSTSQLYSEDWSSSNGYSKSQSGKCQEGSGRIDGGAGRKTSTRSRVGKGDDRQGGGRGAHEGPAERVQGAAQEGVDQGGEGEQGAGESIDWAAEFRLRGLRREGASYDPKVHDELGTGEPTGESFSLLDGRGASGDSKAHRVSKGRSGKSETNESRRRGRSQELARVSVSTTSAAMKDKENVMENDKVNTHALPLHVGRAMMETIHTIHEGVNSAVAEAVYDSLPVTWEMFCSPESELSRQCEHYGFKAVRINLANGYDLYKESTYTDLKTLFLRQRPKRLFVSPRCTYYCSWVDLNYSHRRDVLETKIRKERRMLRSLTSFLLWALSVDPDLELCWEWPQRCRGWKERVVLRFIEALRALNKDPWFCRVDGCRFGLRSALGNFIQKPWYILTTDTHFYREFRLRVCLKNHEHEWLHGVETTRSAYYPKALCVSIARNWQRQLIPERWLTMLWTTPSTTADPFKELYVNEENAEDYSPTTAPGEEEEAPTEVYDLPQEQEEVSEQEKKLWEAKLAKLHKSAGHPTSRNMARMLADAQAPRWKIRMALDYTCPTCKELVAGGESSGQVPPGSLRPLPIAWEHLGIDVGEWAVPNQDKKIKFLLMMDMATRFKVVEPLFVYGHGQTKVETSDDIIRVVTMRWLMDKPKPKVIIPDNAKSLTSQKFVDYLADLHIQMMPPPDNESWSHGVVERAIGQIKITAEKIQTSAPDQDPKLTLGLSTAALNSTEFVKGFSSMQWAYGQQAELDESQLRQQLSLPLDRQQHEFVKLMKNRELAEDAARRSKATIMMGKLKNSSIRQPIRTFSMAQPVMIWRKFLPHTIYKGRKGGRRHTARPRWVGPGRVVLHELVAGQEEGDRLQVVWVVLGNQLYRASVHSVRPLSERESELFVDDSHRWKELKDMVPKRSYIDVVGEEPREGEIEGPHLPVHPDYDTVITPKVRFMSKNAIGASGYPLPEGASGSTVNDYGNEKGEQSLDEIFKDLDDEATGTEIPTTSLRRSSTTSKEPLIRRESTSQPIDVDDEQSVPVEPDAKRPRTSDSVDDEDGLYHDLNYYALESDEGYVMNFEVDLTSKRQHKNFWRNPVAFLVKKVSSAEVNYRRLKPDERVLFDNAKNSEVTSFLKSEAVRRCLTWEEQQEAQKADRVLRARWVLVWKGVPPEDREEALTDHNQNEETVCDSSGTRKAKARIVLLGFQHPDLESSTFQSAAPVQSQLMRNLSLYLVAQRDWILEGLDMKTAFLQTGTEEMEKQQIYTSGVPELRKALGASDDEILKLLKNVYGNATAPRGLWKDVDKTFTRLGGHRVIGDSSFWVWTEPNDHPMNEADMHKVIGFVGGHVDDFNRAGDTENEKWRQVRDDIDKAYKWGTMKTQAYRHTGLDLEVHEEKTDRWISINQDFYVETIMDVAIPSDRLRGDPTATLSSSEIAACRATLGALQWCATQTQLQTCARVNLLLSELTASGTMQVAKEIQELVKEVRSSPTTLKIFKLNEVKHWQDVVVVTLADQAHANRPQGGSTGGLLCFLGGPQHYFGDVGRLNVMAWKTWKLRRKAISTNDGEIQSILEGEDLSFRTRFHWAQLNGCCAIGGNDLLLRANSMVKYVKGILGTDSRGGYDAVLKNESPLLGLSNARSALQAYQLREQLLESGGKLIWVSGDWNLSDALTKKCRSARQGLGQYLRNFTWKLTFDPAFFQSERKNKSLGQSAVAQMRQLQSLVPWKHPFETDV